MDEEFSIDYDIFRVVSSHEPNYATLHELSTVYNISGLFDFLEMLDFRDELTEMAKEKAKADKLKQQQENGGRR